MRILEGIEQSLNHLITNSPNAAEEAEESDDYDSELEEEEESEPNLHQGQRTGDEDTALKEFEEKFNFLQYPPNWIVRLGKNMIEFLACSLRKEAIGAFDHELIAFSAIISMDFHTKTFKSPGVISQAYSAIIYCFQLVAIEVSSQGEQSNPPNIIISILTRPRHH
jgi:hypothetical protein